MKRLSLIVISLVLLWSCKSGEEPRYRSFRIPDIPAYYTDVADINEYMLTHYWDNFFSESGVTDSLAISGVLRPELTQALSNYIGSFDIFPMERAQKAVSKLYSDMVKAHEKDTSAHLIPIFSNLVCDYLYDPNSPLRSEDYYLPFVKELAKSKYIEKDAKAGYVFQEKMCRMNRYGHKVPDFKFKDLEGRKSRLYAIRADYTVLFFSNPGCTSCRDIIKSLQAVPELDAMIAAGKVAVMNIYIDDDLDSWREYATIYPSNWHNGYDYRLIIRNDSIYYVRAIPSLYLLDSEKKVILKDAPVEKVVTVLERIRMD